MIEERYEVHLMDEAPALGSGQRIVVALVGHKWVRARNEVGSPNFTRLRRTVWDDLKPRLVKP